MAATIIPTIAVITLLPDGFNKLSIQLALAGIFGPLPLLASVRKGSSDRSTVGRGIVTCSGAPTLGSWSVPSHILMPEALADPSIGYHGRPPPPSHSSHAFVGQWIATASVLVVGPSTSITPQATGTITPKLRDSPTRGRTGGDEALPRCFNHG